MKNHYESDIKYLSQSLEADPCQSKIYAQRSQAYHLMQEQQNAIIDITKSIYLDKSVVSYVLRANFYASLGKFSHAIQDLEDAKFGIRERQIYRSIIGQKPNQKNYEMDTTDITQSIYQETQLQEKNKQTQRQSMQKSQIQTDNYSEGMKNIDTSIFGKSVFNLSQEIDQKMQIFLSKSVTMQRLPQIKKLAQNYQLQKDQICSQTKQQIQENLKGLLKYELNQTIEGKISQKNKYEQQLLRYQKLMQLQIQILQKQQNQINQLKNQMKYVSMNYEKVFRQDIQMSTLSEKNKEKCILYFHTVCSEMQKFYLGAKILNQFQTEKVSFSDLQGKPLSKKAEVIRKVFRAIDHYSQKMQRVQEVIRELPILGTIFKVIKTVSKGIEWLNQIKQNNQCHNIMMVAATSTTFNQFATKLSFNLYKHYKLMITATQNEHYLHSQWQVVKKTYMDIKKHGIGAKIFSHTLPQSQQQYVLEIGEVHASIIMVALSHKKFKHLFNRQTKNTEEIQQANYQKFLCQVYQTIDILEERLRVKEVMLQNLGISHKKEPGAYFSCQIY